MLSLAFLAGILASARLAKKSGLKPEIILDLSVFVIISAIVGGRVFYVLEFYKDFISNPIQIFFIWEGGLVFFGGIVFSILAIAFYSKLNKLPVLKYLDVITPGVAIGYAIGRIGCFLNGCCYGDLCSLPWAVSFPLAGGLRHPTQIYASLSGLLIFSLLIYLFNKRKFDGQVFASGLILYCVYRFLVEFLRVNPRYFLNLSEAQWVSLAILLLSAWFYLLLRKK